MSYPLQGKYDCQETRVVGKETASGRRFKLNVERSDLPSSCCSLHYFITYSRLPMGLVWYFLGQTFPPKPEWSIEDIPDLTGKVMIVTGNIVWLSSSSAGLTSF